MPRARRDQLFWSRSRHGHGNLSMVTVTTVTARDRDRESRIFFLASNDIFRLTIYTKYMYILFTEIRLSFFLNQNL